MTADTYMMWVGGAEKSGNGEHIPVEDPSTGEVFAYCHSASPEDVDEVVKMAHEVHKSGVWSKVSRHDRADVLDKIADTIEANLKMLIPIEVRQTGRAMREMNAQVPTIVKWYKYYASLIRTEERPLLPTRGKLHNWVDRVPLGVCALITPFNHPLFIASKKIAPALAAGNSVVVKPSELTPITTLLLGKLFKEAGLPDGVFNVIPGYALGTSKVLVEHPLVKKIDLTGSTAAGKAVGAIAGAKLNNYTAELGGKAPLIVFEKANLDLAVNGIAFGSFINSGQTCIAATRIIVQNSIKSELLTKLKTKCESIQRRMGSPSSLNSTMGPMISGPQLDKLIKLVNEAAGQGVDIVTGGKRMTDKSQIDGLDFSKGYFFAPSVLSDGASTKILDTRIWKDEAFGPVIVVVGFDTEEEAVKLANDTEYGLGAAVWTQDISQAFRVTEQIEAGINWINTHHRNDPSSPWGGFGDSGVGNEGGVDAFRAYTKMKSTTINYTSPEESLASEDWFRENLGTVRYN